MSSRQPVSWVWLHTDSRVKPAGQPSRHGTQIRSVVTVRGDRWYSEAPQVVLPVGAGWTTGAAVHPVQVKLHWAKIAGIPHSSRASMSAQIGAGSACWIGVDLGAAYEVLF